MAAGISKEEYGQLFKGASPSVKKQLPSPEKVYPSAPPKETKPPKVSSKRSLSEAFRMPAREAGRKVRKELFQGTTSEEGKKATEQSVRKAANTAERVGVGVIKSFGMFSRHLKGVRHPDDVIQNRELYGVSEDSPLRNIHGTTWGMGLYGYGKRYAKPKGADKVLLSLRQGIPVESLTAVLPEMTPRQISNSVSYLEKQGLVGEEELR